MDASVSRGSDGSKFRRWLAIAGWLACGLVLSVATLWACGALWFDFPVAALKKPVAIAAGLGALAAGMMVKPRRRAALAVAIMVGLVLGWWLGQKPRSDRDWKPEVSRLPRAEIDGDRIVLHDVRDFDYRSEDDFTPAWRTRTLHLSKLQGADIFITYWGSPYMAHPIISFDFGEDGRVCFSIETRQEKGEGYSALGGLYRRFELIYVVAEERDVIRLRTNYRKGEDVYLYRLHAPQVRETFMEYVNAVNALHEEPRWYNAITNNCTSAIRHQRAAERRSTWDWRMLVNGFGDELLYERGGIPHSLPFPELKALSKINDKARAADQDPDFSSRIRSGLPDWD